MYLFLHADEIAKSFWKKQLPILIVKFAAQALEMNKTDDSATQRVENYRQEYEEKVNLLMSK